MNDHTLSAKYNRAAPTWDQKLVRLGYHAAYDHLVGKAALPSAPVVLDAGCGTGAFAAAVFRRVSAQRIDLLDNAPAMRRQARSGLEALGARLGHEFSALYDESVPDQHYDVILAGHLIEHLGDPTEAVVWFKRKLRSGGALLLSVSKPHWCTALLRVLWGHRALPVQAVLQIAKHAGMEGKAVPYSNGPPSRTSMGYIFRISEA